jgi:virginiamycin B lyase
VSRHRTLALAATALVAVVAAAAIAIGFAAGHGKGAPGYAVATIPNATGILAGPTATAIPSAGLTTPSTGPTATVTDTPTPAPTPTPTPAPQAIDVYSLPAPAADEPIPGVVDLIDGPGGALWFLAGMGGNLGFGSVSTAGAVTELAASWNPFGVEPWPMGGLASGSTSLWTVETHGGQDYVGEWTTSGTLQQEFPIPGVEASHITMGGDGALWFTGTMSSPDQGPDLGGFIGRMTTSGQVTTDTLPDPQDAPGYITLGPDSAVWFDVPDAASVGWIDTSTDALHVYAIPGAQAGPITYGVDDVSAAADGSAWVAWGADDEVVHVQRDGSMTEYSAAGCGGVIGVVATSDAPWISSPTAMCELSYSGAVTAVYPLPSSIVSSGAGAITWRPDGNLWFGGQGYIGRLNPLIPPP